MTLVLGVDPSLTACGFAWGADRTGRFRPSGAVSTGLPRLRWLRDSAAALVQHLEPYGLRLIVYEAPPYGAKQAEKFKHELAGGWWFILDGLSSTGVPVAFANVSHVKMIATGKGSGEGTDKPAVVAGVRQRFGYPGTDNNEADALALAALGYEHLSLPLADLPQSHRRAVGLVTWPYIAPTDPLAAARAALGG